MTYGCTGHDVPGEGETPLTTENIAITASLDNGDRWLKSDAITLVVRETGETATYSPSSEGSSVKIATPANALQSNPNDSITIIGFAPSANSAVNVDRVKAAVGSSQYYYNNYNSARMFVVATPTVVAKGVTSAAVNFKNVFSTLSFNLTGTILIKSITVEPVNADQMSGSITQEGTVDLSTGIYTKTKDGENRILMSLGDGGVRLSQAAITIPISIAPIEALQDGLRVTFTDNNNHEWVHTILVSTSIVQGENHPVDITVDDVPLKVIFEDNFDWADGTLGGAPTRMFNVLDGDIGAGNRFPKRSDYQYSQVTSIASSNYEAATGSWFLRGYDRGGCVKIGQTSDKGRYTTPLLRNLSATPQDLSLI